MFQIHSDLDSKLNQVGREYTSKLKWVRDELNEDIERFSKIINKIKNKR